MKMILRKIGMGGAKGAARIRYLILCLGVIGGLAGFLTVLWAADAYLKKGELDINPDGSGTIKASGGDMIYLKNDGNVGIGTVAPVRTLDVLGSTGVGIGTSTAGDAVIVSTTGNVGIGSAVPTEVLDVVGNITATGTISGTISETDPTVDTESECETEWGGVNILLETEIDASSELATIMDDETGSGALVFGTSPTFTTSVIMSDGATLGQAAGPLLNFDDSNNYLEITGANVGIGTVAPSELFHVFGGDLRVESSTETTFITGDTYLYMQPVADTRFRIGVWDTSSGALPLTLQDAGGNVGIGTTAPIRRLDVVGTSGVGIGTSSAGDSLVVSTSGNIGIGTTAPEEELHIDGDILLNADAAIKFKTSDRPIVSVLSYSNGWDTISIGDSSGGTDEIIFYADGKRVLDITDGSDAGRVGIMDTGPDAWLEVSDSGGGSTDLFMLSSNDDTNGDRFIVKNSGNVGIGTTAPVRRLDVLGSTGVGIGTSAAGDVLVVSTIGNVGIGSAAPLARLDLPAATASVPSLRVAAGTAPSSPSAGDIYADADQLFFYDGSTWDDMTAGGGADNLGNHTATQNIILGNYYLSGDGGNEGVFVKSDGNVGIGTTAPVRRLDVVGTSGVGIGTSAAGDVLVVSTAGNVGIGTTAPLTRLHLSNDGAILAQGTYGSGWTEPDLGEGTRLVWYPKRAAFRAGYVDGTQWDDANIGDYSFATGYATTASGLSSTAIGSNSTASGQSSTALGDSALASGDSSVALALSTAEGVASVSMGYWALASGLRSIAIGPSATASGGYSIAIGQNLENSTANSFAVGFGGIDVLITSGSVDFQGSNLTTAGNVGIGTTSPQQKLHVQGLCVTGDTLLPVIRAEVWESSRQNRDIETVSTYSHLTNMKGTPEILKTRDINTPKTRDMEQAKIEHGSVKSVKIEHSGPWQIEYIPIVQVQPGDYVLSLNEEKGKIEPHRIIGLLDMGVKPVFRLTTATGRTIRTTGNHPYLTRDGWRKVIDIKVGQEIAVPKEISGRVSLSSDGDVRSKLLAESQQGLLSQQQAFPLFSSPIWINEYAGKNEGDTNYTYGNSPYKWKSFKEITRHPQYKNCLSQIGYRLGNKFYFACWRVFHLPEVYHILKTMSSLISGQPAHAGVIPLAPALPDYLDDGSWMMDNGQNLPSTIHKPISSSDIIWDEIVSIEYVGEEQVYDIEVEGTHNFIGNDIFAHNTYITGNTGIGTSAPARALDVLGSTGVGIGTSAAGDVLVVSTAGNVGIGTTSPTAKLHINGAAAFVKVTHDAPGASEDIDWSASNKHEMTLDSAATTLTFTAPGAPCNVVLMIKNTSSRTITWPATVKWAGGSAPTLSSGATDIDIVSFYFDGTNYYAVASQDFS